MKIGVQPEDYFKNCERYSNEDEMFGVEHVPVDLRGREIPLGTGIPAIKTAIAPFRAHLGYKTE